MGNALSRWLSVFCLLGMGAYPMTDGTERLLPQDPTTERAVLASMIADGACLKTGVENLGPSAFYGVSHKRTFQALTMLYTEGVPVDLITLTNQLRKLDWLEAAGTEVALVDLVDGFSSVNIESHLGILNKLELRRRAIQECERISSLGFDDATEPGHLLERVTALTDNLSDGCAKAGIVSTGKVSLVGVDHLAARFDKFRDYGADEVGHPINPFWPQFNALFRPAVGMLTTITGVPTHGKSEFLDAIAVSMAREHNWKWLFYSPENYPYEVHLEKLIEKHTGKAFASLSDEEYAKGKAWMNDHFHWILPESDTVTLSEILRQWETAKKKFNIDAAAIDPWNDVTLDGRNAGERDDEFLVRKLTKIRWIGRRMKIAPWIVAHPRTMERNEKSGRVYVPSAYSINGGAAWYNKSDNILVLYRHFGKDQHTSVHVQKVKFRRYGHPGVVDFNYEYPPGMYVERPPKDDRKSKGERDKEEEENPLHGFLD